MYCKVKVIKGIKSERVLILRIPRAFSLILICSYLSKGEILEIAFASCSQFELEKIDDYLFQRSNA